jgi:5-formyltetrahydrofolate cyclo-ligase
MPVDISHSTNLKDALRRTMRERLRGVTGAQQAIWSAAILRWLTHDDTWAEAGNIVAIFGGIKSEPNLLPLIPWMQAREAQVAFFAIEDSMLTPHLVSGEKDLISGKMGVLEPRRTEGSKLDIADLSTVLVPGLAFGRNDGSRLGRGKGYYDRVLGAMAANVRTIGVGYDLQFVPDVPCEEHDVRLSALVSESGWVEVD